MTGAARTSRYFAGEAQSWLDDEPAAPEPVTPDNREEFKRRTQEAAASVGYVAPSEQPKPEVAPVALAKRPKKVATPAPVVEIEKGKGRPKGDRSIQMSVRIRQEHDDLIKAIAQDDFTVASIVEAAMIAFAKTLVAEKKYKRMPLEPETLALAKEIAGLRS